MGKNRFQTHLKEEHQKTPISENIKSIVYGGTDGIITTFAVVAGFSGATVSISGTDSLLPISIVILFGLANLFGDGFSMAMGDFLSHRAKKKLYDRERAKELQEIHNDHQFEYDECVDILEHQGMKKNDAVAVMDVYQKYPEIWADFMMRYELEMEKPEENPIISASFTFLSFLFFGFIPLIPYLFFDSSHQHFSVSIITSAIALGVLGVLRAKVTRENIFFAILEVVCLGGVAGLIAYWVGSLVGY